MGEACILQHRRINVLVQLARQMVVGVGAVDAAGRPRATMCMFLLREFVKPIRREDAQPVGGLRCIQVPGVATRGEVRAVLVRHGEVEVPGQDHQGLRMQQVLLHLPREGLPLPPQRFRRRVQLHRGFVIAEALPRACREVGGEDVQVPLLPPELQHRQAAWSSTSQ